MMTDAERVRKLSDYLWNIVPGIPDSMAAVIISNPKAHMDALVEAGVVEPMNAATGGDWESWWRIPKPKPHVHEPYVSNFVHLTGEVALGCHRCGEHCLVPSSLPIEWPDDE
jgi:hypothetical protein